MRKSTGRMSEFGTKAPCVVFSTLLNSLLIVRAIFSSLIKKENLQRAFAAAFLVMMIAEWGSHGIIYAHADSAAGQSISSTNGHEDPCGTLILCSDNQRRDHQTPNFGHDASQHNALFDQFSRRHLSRLPRKDPLPSSATVNGLFRPPNPPFHPPKNS